MYATLCRSYLIFLFVITTTWGAEGFDAGRHPVPREHPRLFGSRARLQELARDRSDRYTRLVAVARQMDTDPHTKMVSRALVAAIEQDHELGRQAVEMALATVRGPIRRGHVTFGHDLARCAIAYDLCHASWTADEREEFHGYLNATVDANVNSETHVFHNGWYGYKNWGIGLACYASYHENARSPAILRDLERDYLERAAPALELAGAGGGWAEGYYVNYWLYEWLFFCQVAHWCEGVDYFAAAPSFYRQRAVASMFETYPGIGIYNSRRPIPMGDGGGRTFGGDRDKTLSARRILVSRYRDDSAHQFVHAFNETTPRSATGTNAYKDFLWRDTAIRAGNLEEFHLSHFSPGPGYLSARSSWNADATYFFFKCGPRFTAHQHLDVGHFLIYHGAELAGDGGHYDGFGTAHDVNYHLRTIAHSTMLVHDPEESWPAIRAGTVTGNDGGQHHDWPHHNGAVTDPRQWHRDRDLYDIGTIITCEDHGSYLYLAADCTKAYRTDKLASFVRQVVYLRPGTFVIHDRVISTKPNHRKTWLLQAMKAPERHDHQLVVTNGNGRLFVQTLLPVAAEVSLVSGDALYRYGGHSYPPSRDTGAAPECRIEVSPSSPREQNDFLHVLTAVDATVDAVAPAELQKTAAGIRVRIDDVELRFASSGPGVEVKP